MERELLDNLRRVSGKQNLLFDLAGATLEQPDGVVRDIVFPVVSEQTLRDLAREAKTAGPSYRTALRTVIRIHSQLKSPSSSEVASMIEGVVHHCTEMEVDRQYVDSHGQSTIASAFCRLLGFQLMPRRRRSRFRNYRDPMLDERTPMPTCRPS